MVEKDSSKNLRLGHIYVEHPPQVSFFTIFYYVQKFSAIKKR